MKLFTLLLTLSFAVMSFAGQRQEKITCFVGAKKVSESLRTTLTDGKIESRSSQTKLINPHTNEISLHQELVLVEITREPGLEIQKTSGVYVTLSAETKEKLSIQKIESLDTYQINGQRKTLIKSVIGGEELTLFSVDTEIQLNPHLKIYTSVLKNKADESSILKNNYSCRLELL